MRRDRLGEDSRAYLLERHGFAPGVVAAGIEVVQIVVAVTGKLCRMWCFGEGRMGVPETILKWGWCGRISEQQALVAASARPKAARVGPAVRVGTEKKRNGGRLSQN